MKKYFNYFSFSTMIFLVVSCSSVKFDKSQKDVCLGSDLACTFNTDNTLTFDYDVTVPHPDNRVDILFVDDNSKTMMKDQQQLATRFTSFMSSIQNLDWQIGITTTDMRLNNSLPYTGGKLVPFTDSNGNAIVSVLNKGVQSYATLFQNTIQRKETIDCIWYYQHGMPTSCDVDGDERGIFAALTVMKNNPNGLLRSGAPLDIVIVSNEDERSYGGVGSPDAANYPLINGQDYPADIVTLSNQMGKQVKVHSIIIRPGDSSCLTSEKANAFNDSALPAPTYAAASSVTGGLVGSICANDYSSQLQAISKDIGTGALDTIKDLPCVPKDGIVNLYNPSTAANPQVVTGVVGRSFSVNPTIPADTTVRLQFKCAAMN